MPYMKPGSPFLYAEESGDVVGIKDEDGSEGMLVRVNPASGQAERYDPATGAYVVVGGGTGGSEVVAALSASNTGAQNIAALQAAHDSLAGSGGVVLMPAGAFDLAGTVDINEGFTPGTLSYQQVVFQGAGIGATRLTQLTAGIPTFNKTRGHAHGFKDFYLLGPGTENAESVGIQWDNAAGGGIFENLWIEGFGVGCRFVDATSMTFISIHLNANGINFQAGFNCDIFQFIGGRNQNAITSCLQIGYRDAAHTTGSLQCNPIKVIGMRFGASPLAIDIPDYGASNIEFDSCYFENLTQIASMGDAATATGPRNVQFSNCFFTWVGGSASGGSATQFVANLHADQLTTLTLRHCRTDTSSFSGTWIAIGRDCRVGWYDNTLPTSGSHVAWTGRGVYSIDARQDFTLDRGEYKVYDGAVMGALVPIDVRMANGTGKTHATFKRLNAATGAELGIAGASIQDYNGQFVAFKGPLRPATPSGALPTAAATYRGICAYQEGGAGVADTLVCCMKDAADAYSWKVAATG